MNTIVNNTTANTNATNSLFTKYINSEAAAEIAADKIRETIFSIVLVNTSEEERITEEMYETLLKIFHEFCEKKEIKLYENDNYVESYHFKGGTKLCNLELFLSEVIIKCGCYFCDTITYEGNRGICWFHGSSKFAIV